jgi:hypothetical protein
MVKTQKKRQENIALHNVDISVSTVKNVETAMPYNGVIISIRRSLNQNKLMTFGTSKKP